MIQFLDAFRASILKPALRISSEAGTGWRSGMHGIFLAIPFKLSNRIGDSMPASDQLWGPLLAFQGEDSDWATYSILMLWGAGRAAPPRVSWTPPGQSVATELNGTVLMAFEAASLTAGHWELKVRLTESGQRIPYRVDDRPENVFHVPAAGSLPRLAYASCNGFSHTKYRAQATPHRWARLSTLHQEDPFHLLLMGGDQVYSDGIFKGSESRPLVKWDGHWLESRKARTGWTALMQADAQRFYVQNAYLGQWFKAWGLPGMMNSTVADLLGSIPTVMMWDDHDILDGWGSHRGMHDWPVSQGVFAEAKQAFEVFQLHAQPRTACAGALLNTGGNHSRALRSGRLAILALDLRSERRPRSATPALPDQVMAASSWAAVEAYLSGLPDKDHPGAGKPLDHLLVMSSIPVTYADFQSLSTLLEALPGRQELEDDLRDHWLGEAQRQERLRLIRALMRVQQNQKIRVSILSGDVHVAAQGILQSSGKGHENSPQNTINQLISSGIAHPPPGAMAAWFVSQNLLKEPQTIERGLTETLIPFQESGKLLEARRNFLTVAPKNRDDCDLDVQLHLEDPSDPGAAGSVFRRVIHGIS